MNIEKRLTVFVNGEEKEVEQINFDKGYLMNFEINETDENGYPVYYTYDKENELYRDKDGENVEVIFKNE